jgi:hypothetical protein
MPATMPPSQKASKFRMGRGREIISATIPIRTGSNATNNDKTKTALHIADT